MLKASAVTLVAVVALALGGCASGSKKTSPGGSDYNSGQGTQPYAGDSIASGSATIGGADPALAAERALTTNVIYFDFDSTEIKGEYQSVVDNFARYLSSNPSARVRLEGHGDERGTREYNVGLGERRANAVSAALTGQGASQGQISVLSYGEERPADPGHSEDAWAKNRRVQIIRQ